MRKQIKFNNGHLKVLQISDLQDNRFTCVDTLRFMEAAVKSIKPDLIVFTGDQLDVVDLWGKGEKCRKNVEKAINRLFSVFESFNIPFVLTFGNHDRETGLPNDEQAKIYAKMKNCICFDDVNDGRPDAATFNVPILSSDGSRTAMNIYVVDTGTKINGVYGGVRKEQLEWLDKTSREVNADSIVFQHIPVDEIYELLEKVPKGTKGAEPAYGNRKGEFYKRRDDIKFMGAYGETPAALSRECGEFEQLKKQGDVFAVYCGHDHYDSFIGMVDGIDLGYCPGAGYNTYGIRQREVRVFEFDENDVKNYKTYTVSYGDVCDKPLAEPVKTYIFSIAPCCTPQLPMFAVKVFSLLALIAVLFVLLAKIIGSKIVIGILLAMLAVAVVYFGGAIIYNTVTRKKLIERYQNERGN
ncbi:MAG TPA: metallophosphoesterase [Oscillospiraceae bacterium]|nr:metallophosphoesterase [Oscillospiraceae bacterium]